MVTSIGAPPWPTVPVAGLAEGIVLSAIWRAGVPLQRVRPALEVVRREIGVAHALASKRLDPDGAERLDDYAEALTESGAQVARELVLRSGQRGFSEIVEDHLKRIESGCDGYARVIRLRAYEQARVLAQPTRSFG